MCEKREQTAGASEMMEAFERVGTDPDFLAVQNLITKHGPEKAMAHVFERQRLRIVAEKAGKVGGGD